jgi:hypothetical protein
MKRQLLIVSLLALVASTASAATTVYTDIGAFLAAMPATYYFENFNSLTDGPLTAPVAFSGDGFSYTMSASTGELYASTWVDDETNRRIGPQQPSDTLTITFTSGNVTAIGGLFFLTDAYFDLVEGDLSLALSDGTTETVTYGAAPTAQFRGFISDAPLSSLTVTGPAEVFVALDDLYVAGAEADTPEPATALLFGVGALALLALRRRVRA